MTWDIALNSRGTLAGGIVTGDNEILQRLWIRLNRELGEWFLNTEVGLPWYQQGHGMLGSKPQRKNDIDLLIRHEISRTEGIEQILKYNAIYASGTRVYDVYCVVLLPNNRMTDFSFGVSMTQGAKGMPIIPASFIKFENGKTLQELYDSGELQGDPGIPGVPGLDGRAATVAVGSTTNLDWGLNAYVNNSGDNINAVLDFGIPRGSKGDTGESSTITVGETITGNPGDPAAVVNTGTSTKAVLKFTIPSGKSSTVTVGTTTTGAAGTPASVTNVGTTTDATLDFVIPKGSQGEAAALEIVGGSTISVTQSTIPGGTKFDLGVIDNAHKHNISNIDGLQAALDSKLNAANIKLTGAVYGDASTTGGVTTINTKWRSGSGINWTSTASRYWFKVADFTTGAVARPNLVLMVSSVSIDKNYTLGIVHARAYVSPISSQNITLDWLSSIGNTFDPGNFVLAHKRVGSTNTLEVWMRLPSAIELAGYYVQVLQDFDGETGASNQWTMYDQRAPEGAGTIDPSLTQYPSVLGTLHNSVARADKATVADRATTADTANRASQADILTTARSIVLTGDVFGSGSFNGGSNVTISTTTNGGLIR